MFKKKILTLIIIALLAINSIGMCSAMTVNIKSICYCESKITLWGFGDHIIWKEYQEYGRHFNIPYDVVQKADYLDVTGGSSLHDCYCTHHIKLSDDFKTKIPSHITFYHSWTWDDTPHRNLWFANHNCTARYNEHNTINWTFKRWD